MKLSHALKVNLALFSAVLIWSFSFVAIRIALQGYSPASISLFRFTLASLCLGLFFNKANVPQKIAKKHLAFFAFCGLVGLFCYSLFLNYGEQTVSSGLASFMIGQTPVITAALAITFLKERPSLITLCGIAISCLGIVIIVLDQSIALESSLGFFLLLLATLCGSIHSIAQKSILRSYSPYVVTCFSTWFATLGLLIFLPGLLTDVAKAPQEASIAVIFLGILPSTLGQWLWSYGLSQTLVVRATAYLYAMPILSTLLGWMILGEIPTQAALLGGFIALFGSMLVKKEPGAQRRANETPTDDSLSLRNR